MIIDYCCYRIKLIFRYRLRALLPWPGTWKINQWKQNIFASKHCPKGLPYWFSRINFSRHASRQRRSVQVPNDLSAKMLRHCRGLTNGLLIVYFHMHELLSIAFILWMAPLKWLLKKRQRVQDAYFDVITWYITQIITTSVETYFEEGHKMWITL